MSAQQLTLVRCKMRQESNFFNNEIKQTNCLDELDFSMIDICLLTSVTVRASEDL